MTDNVDTDVFSKMLRLKELEAEGKLAQVWDPGFLSRADATGPQRPWSLDLFPVIVSARSWEQIETGVLQRMRIGAHTMVGFGSHVGKDVPPFMVVDGNPLAVRAVNLTGLRRRGFSNERCGVIRQMHKLLFRDGLTLDAARAAIARLPSPKNSSPSTSITSDVLASSEARPASPRPNHAASVGVDRTSRTAMSTCPIRLVIERPPA